MQTFIYYFFKNFKSLSDAYFLGIRRIFTQNIVQFLESICSTVWFLQNKTIIVWTFIDWNVSSAFRYYIDLPEFLFGIIYVFTYFLIIKILIFYLVQRKDGPRCTKRMRSFKGTIISNIFVILNLSSILCSDLIIVFVN